MLGPLVDAALPEFRAHAESLMVDTCTITRDGDGEPVFNHETGQYDDPPRVTVYAGRFRLQAKAAPQEASSGGREWVVQTSVAQLPIDGSESVRSGHVLEVTVSEHDPATVGRKFTLVGRGTTKSHATKREFEVSEVTG